MSRRKRRAFTDEQKAASVEHVKRTGKTVYQAAQDLDLTETALRRWISEAEKQARPAELGELSAEERAELHRLRRENQRLQQERDFLKKPRPSSPRRARSVRADQGGEGDNLSSPDDV
jgi:transposase